MPPAGAKFRNPGIICCKTIDSQNHLWQGSWMAGVPWKQCGKAGGLTDTQQKYLDAIAEFAKENSLMPTMAELAEARGVTRQVAWVMVEMLRGKGYLESGKRGQMVFTEKGRQALGGSE